jgi:AcrR family transcriptional regulator
MSNPKKRTYRSEKRQLQAADTRRRILLSAKKLFQSEGFACVTIEQLARDAGVSPPMIYSLFQSKRGILRALMDEALPPKQFEALVEKNKTEKSAKKRLCISAKIARQIYDAEKEQMAIFTSASVLAPEFKELEKEREERRYSRQEETIKTLAKEKTLAKGLSLSKARDILWTFTGRDLYRLFVIERGWSSGDYEKWLANLLITTLLKEDHQLY